MVITEELTGARLYHWERISPALDHLRALGVPHCPGQKPPSWQFSALRTHSKATYKTNLLWKTLRALSKEGGPGPCVSSQMAFCSPAGRPAQPTTTVASASGGPRSRASRSLLACRRYRRFFEGWSSFCRLPVAPSAPGTAASAALSGSFRLAAAHRGRWLRVRRRAWRCAADATGPTPGADLG